MDYAKIVTLVQRLIAANGRACTLQVLDATIDDSNMPWKGPGVPTVLSEVDAVAVFLPATGEGFGTELVPEELLTRVSEVCLIAPGSTDSSNSDLILDNSIPLKVEWCHVLKPGDLILLYAFGINR